MSRKRELLYNFIDWDTKEDRTAPWKWRVRWLATGVALAYLLHWAGVIAR
jgi:hypothetical protein